MKLTVSKIHIMGAQTGKENPLPMFRDRNHSPKLPYNETLTEEEKHLLGYETGFRVLPYLMQDRYSRKRRPMELKTAVLENDKLKATFLCGYGAKLHSLVKKSTGKEILFSNTVMQPGNLAIRNAWTSGGIEWNIGQLGHTFTTCEDVFMAKMKDGKTEFLRIFEFERQKGLFWQIDFYLPEGSELLYAYVRIVNPRDEMTPMYWWTNTAVPESTKTRLFSNTARCLVMGNRGVWTATDLPYHPSVPEKDISYSKNFPFSNEFFFQTPKGETMPWEAVINEDGTMFVEASTDFLRYRKMFCWGSHQGGVHWQEYLSEPGKGYYVEIQAGLAPTQRHGVQMPANATWDFVEAFGETAAPAGCHDPNWEKAQGKVEKALKKEIRETKLYRMLAKARKNAQKTPTEFLHFGSGWGALEAARLQTEGKTVPEGFAFPEASMGSLQLPWLGLLENGTMPEHAPENLSPSWMVQKEWRALLEADIEKAENQNWFAYMHLGNMYYEEGLDMQANEMWLKSISLRPTQWVYRNLSGLSRDYGDIEKALQYMDNAYALDGEFCDPGFYEEYFKLLEEQKEYAKIWNAFEKMPASYKDMDRLKIFAGKAALQLDILDYMEPVFETEFAVVREGEMTVVEMWFEYAARKLAKERGVPYSEDILKEAKETLIPPKTVDYRIN